MKKITYLTSFVIMMAMTLFSCGRQDNPTPEPEQPAKKAQLTIMYYGTIGDNNDNTAEEMWEIAQRELKGNNDIRFVVCHKYAKPDHFNGKYANPGDLVMFQLTDTTKLANIGKNYAQNKPDQAMYDEHLLTDFINFAAEKAPAEKYVFMLFGHGGGFDAMADYEKGMRKTSQTRRALLYDEWFPLKGSIGGGEALNMYELQRGIMGSNVPHFDLLLLYDCLLGNVESLYDIHTVADYIITSEHTLALNNKPYEQFIKSFNQQTDIATACSQALANIPSSWKDDYTFLTQWNGDLKLLKCDQMGLLIEPAKKLAARLQEIYPTMQEPLDSAMVHTYQIFMQLQLYDFADYAHKVAEYTKDEQLKQLSQQIDEAFAKIILARNEVHGSPYGDLPQFTLSVILHGQKAYEAATSMGHTFQEAYEYTNWHLFTDWGKWLMTNQQEPKDQSRGPIGQPVGQTI